MSFASVSSWRDVRLAAGARAVSVCGDFLAATSLALALQEAGAGGLAVSALLLAASAPVALLAPVAGRIADRADSRTVLVVAGAAQALVCAALAFVSSPGVIIALVAVLACGLAVTQPTLAALLPAMVRREDMPRASGINQTAAMVGMLVAPALAGVLVGRFGVRVPLLIDAASYLSLIAAGLLIRTRRAERAPAAGPPWRLRDDRLIRAMIGALAAAVAGVGAINVIEVFFIRETLQSSTTVFGLVSAAWTGGMLLGAVLFGHLGRRQTAGPRGSNAAGPGPARAGAVGSLDAARLVRIVLLLIAGSCAPIVIGAAAWDALLLLPLWFAGGICNGGLNVCTAVVLAERVPAAARGRAFALMSSATQGAGMIGFLIGGPLVDAFPPRPLVAAAGLAGIVAVLLCVGPVRRAGREIAPSGPVETPRTVPAGDSVGP
ncbi:MFS transporter [Couchioplanes caeruleus]|uniref:MFS transporter n=1 Tax=Couchioplanes caeruleus TaxID=56438 RepID=UPI0020BF83AA|nr:MFS transporter [Couchioplanes caeruleus]UQU64690.1 MFS transporter [Couchioplanes caeruleus]